MNFLAAEKHVYFTARTIPWRRMHAILFISNPEMENNNNKITASGTCKV